MADETTTPETETEQEPDKDHDKLVALLGEVKRHCDRMKKSPPTSVQALSLQVSGTVMELLGEIVTAQVDLYELMGGAIDDLNDRVEDIEEGQSPPVGPSDDEIGKLKDFVAFANDMIDHALPQAAAEPDVRTKLEEMRKLGAECAGILDELSGEGEDELEDDGETEGTPEGTTN
jgi:hypothetical protein